LGSGFLESYAKHVWGFQGTNGLFVRERTARDSAGLSLRTTRQKSFAISLPKWTSRHLRGSVRPAIPHGGTVISSLLAKLK